MWNTILNHLLNDRGGSDLWQQRKCFAFTGLNIDIALSFWKSVCTNPSQDKMNLIKV